jgi:uncharacterized protein (DUF1800 family)
MRLLLVAFAFAVQGFAIAAAPRAGGPMGYDDARQLLVRTSFSATDREVRAFAALGRAEAVDRLLGMVRPEAGAPPPEWVGTWDPPPRIRQMSEEERRAFQREQVQRGIELRSWWLTEMLTTPYPLTERMTLFWHNHFVSSLQKVRAAQLMHRQNALLRRHALGSFAVLLHAVAKDPAMIVYLDGASNRRGQPNENFAREVMELFTLGEGRYTEQDVKEAARAFTGWSIDPQTGAFLFRRPAHDDGVKTVLGVSGNHDGDAVLDILLARPETAEHIVAKLWREFVSPTPDAAEVKRIAARFRDSRYDIRTALREVLLSEAFYAPSARAALVKSPVDLVVGTLRQFAFETGEVTPFVLQLRQLGQDLLAPPNVKGWPGGETWINSTTLLARRQWLDRILRADEQEGGMRPVNAAPPAPPAVAGGIQRPAIVAPERIARAMADLRFDSARWFDQFAAADVAGPTRLLLPSDPVGGSHASPDARGSGALRALLQDPTYQLK